MRTTTTGEIAERSSFLLNLTAPPRAVLAQPVALAGLVKPPCGQTHDSLCSVGFAGFEVEAVEFEEHNTHYKTRSLLAIHERMVTDNVRCVEGGHFDDAGGISASVVLARPGEGRFQESLIPNSRGTAANRQIPIMDRERITDLDP